MNISLRRSVAILPGLLAIAVAAQPVLGKSDSEQIGLSVGRLLEEGRAHGRYREERSHAHGRFPG